MIWVIVALCALAALLAALAFALPSFIVAGKRQTLSEALKWQSEHYDTSFYDRVSKTDYEILSDGYALHAQLLQNSMPTDKYVIISHGYTDNRMGALKYARIYLELGFNCIIYDLRGHGENAAHFTTYGILEGRDLQNIIADTRARYKDIAVLGLHGESLGAATTVSALGGDPKVNFAVADCGFSDIENVLKQSCRGLKLPLFLVDMASFTCKLRYRYSFKEMRPIDALDKNKIPVMFIHGENDDFIVLQNSKDMAARTRGYCELHIIPGAGHAGSVLTATEEYKCLLEEFLKKILPPTLTTQRLVIDAVKEADREDYFFNISHDEKVLETFICRYAKTLDDFDFSTYLGRNDLFAIRLKSTKKLIGIISCFDEKQGVCEIGYGIGSRFWGNGYATEAVQRFIRFLFEERGIDTVCASFFTGNEASKRVMEKCGMTYSRHSEKELVYQGVERDLTYYSINKKAGS